jgi:hypothetical protein
MNQQPIRKDTFLLASMFHNINNAKINAEVILNNSMHPYTKKFILQCNNKLNWCIDNFKMLTSSLELKKEFDSYDTIVFDSVREEMIQMNHAGREAVEEFAKSINKQIKEHNPNHLEDTIKKQYEFTCNAIVDLYCERYSLKFKEWFLNNVGEVAVFETKKMNFVDIKRALGL